MASNRKTNEQRRDELNKKIEQLRAQRQALDARISKEQRAARTRRLIEIGAEVEAALGYSLDTIEARKALGDFLRGQEARGKWVTKAIEESAAKTQNEEG